MPNKPSKVVYVITKSVWSGAGKYVFDLASNLPKNRFYPIIAAGGQDDLARRLLEKNIEYREIKNFQRDVNIFRDFLLFLKYFLCFLKSVLISYM